MTIDSTIRKAFFTGNGMMGQRKTIAFAIEKETDAVIYDGDVLLQLTKDYTIELISGSSGFPATTPNQFDVQLVAATINTVTVYRSASIPTQKLSISSGFQTKDMEAGFDRASISVSNTPLASNGENIDLDGGRMQELGTPISDSDATTTDYMQKEFSKKGKIPSGVGGTDDAKALYSDTETTVRWKTVFDVPAATTTNQLLTVDWDGEVKWMDYPDFAPVLQNKPLYLSLDASLDEVWRTIRTIPVTALSEAGDVVHRQPADNVVLRTGRMLPSVPVGSLVGGAEYILGLDGGGTEVTQSVVTTKVTYIQEYYPTANNGTKVDFLLKNRDNGTLNHGLLEWDLSGMTGVDADTFVSGNMVLDRTHNSGSETTVKIARLKTSFEELEATWEESQTSTSWDWQDGAYLDVDLDMETYDIQIGTSSTGQETFDISSLVIDAILNRSGILRICIYIEPSNASSTNSQSKFGSDLGTNPPKIDVVHASSERQLKWKKTLSTSNLKCGGVGQQVGSVALGEQPHIEYYSILDVKHGHTTGNPLSIASCAYASDNQCEAETVADIIAPHLSCQFASGGASDKVFIFPLGIQLTGLTGGGSFDNPNVSLFVYPEEDNA